MREVVQSDKHNLRKSANRNAQISVIHSAYVLICALQFADYLRLCLSPRTTSRTISFSISNSFWFLIPFFDICSTLAVLSPGLFGFVLLCSFTWSAARSQLLLFVVLAGGFGVSQRAATSNLSSSPDPPIPSQTDVCSTIEESIQDRRLFTIQCSWRISTSYKFAVPRNRLQTVQACERRTSPFNGIERSLSRAVVIKAKSLPIPATSPRFQQRYLCTSRTMGESISTIQHSPRKSTSYKFAAPRYRLTPMALQTVQVSVEPRLSTATHKAEMALKDRSVVSWSHRPSPLPRFQQRCLCTSRRDACERISAIQAVLKGRTVSIRKGNKH